MIRLSEVLNPRVRAETLTLLAGTRREVETACMVVSRSSLPRGGAESPPLANPSDSVEGPRS